MKLSLACAASLALGASAYLDQISWEDGGEALDLALELEAALAKDAEYLEQWTSGTDMERLELRRSAARHLFGVVKESEWWAQRPRAVQEAYMLWPMEDFYMSGPMPRRLYGVCEYPGGGAGLHAVTAHAIFGNDVVGGIPLTTAGECDLVRVDKWPAGAQATIELMQGGPAMYYDPLGWRLLVG